MAVILGCGNVFTPQETEVFAEERLFIQGRYMTVRRWGCHSTHYYRQHVCLDELVPPFTEFHPHVVHGSGGAHDACPWRGCPNGNPPHGQRATTLWVRKEFAGEGQPRYPAAGATMPLQLEAYERATEQWRESLDETARERLRDAIAADTSVDPESRDDSLVIVGWVGVKPLCRRMRLTGCARRYAARWKNVDWRTIRRAINPAFARSDREQEACAMNGVSNRLAKDVSLAPEAAAEWRRLVEGQVVTDDHGLFLRGELLDVVVSTWQSEEKEGYFDAHVTAFQPGGKRVRLDGMAVHARGQDEVGVILRVGRITERGDFVIDGLPTGVSTELQSQTTLSKHRERSRDAEAYAAKEAEAGAGPAPQRLLTVESADGTVRGTMRFLSDETAEVVFETNESRWAGAVVRFALVQETGRVEYEGEARLDYVRDGLWEGRGPEGIRVEAATDLVFEVQGRT
jgi:hypothetical protein